MLGQHLGPFGDVEAEGDGPGPGVDAPRRRPERLEYDPGRLGVDRDVPFGRWRRVAGRSIAPAHDHQASQKSRQLGLSQDCQGNVRQRRQRHERQLPGAAARLVDDQVRAETWRGWHRRRGQNGVADAARAVGLRRRDERPSQRRLAAESHLHVRTTGQLEDGAGVLGDLAGVDVAGGAGHGDDLAFGRGGRVQQGQAIVDAGVAVDQDRDNARHFAHGGMVGQPADQRNRRRRPVTSGVTEPLGTGRPLDRPSVIFQAARLSPVVRPPTFCRICAGCTLR